MRKYIDGNYSDMTPDEIAALNQSPNPPNPTTEERLAAIEEELAAAKILLGVDV